MFNSKRIDELEMQVSFFSGIGVFLVLREMFCWYFKINKRVKLLSDIKDELIEANKVFIVNKMKDQL